MVKRLLNSKISDLIAWVLICCSLTGCGVNHNIKQYKKHKAKIIAKGELIPKDTIIVTNTDTITETITKNDTTFVTRTITNTITSEPVIEVKTKWQTRYETKYKYKTVKVENKAMLDSLNRVIKIERQETKRVKHESRKSKWWLWLLIGISLGLATPFILKKLL